MKVTDELSERLVLELHARGLSAMGCNDAVYGALKAVLADIPDPEQVRAEIMEGLAYGRSVETQALDARIAELEAKLDKVRAWRVEYDEPTEYRNGLSHEAGEALDVILDGKDPP